MIFFIESMANIVPLLLKEQQELSPLIDCIDRSGLRRANIIRSNQWLIQLDITTSLNGLLTLKATPWVAVKREIAFRFHLEGPPTNPRILIYMMHSPHIKSPKYSSISSNLNPNPEKSLLTSFHMLPRVSILSASFALRSISSYVQLASSADGAKQPWYP